MSLALRRRVLDFVVITLVSAMGGFAVASAPEVGSAHVKVVSIEVAETTQSERAHIE